jgi:hypothetical protein
MNYSSRNGWIGALAGVLSFVVAQGCGDDEETNGTGGSAGSGGTAGIGGTAGTGGKAGTGGMSGSSGSAGVDGGGDAGRQLSCAYYCATILANCTNGDAGNNAQFANETACTSFCNGLDEGSFSTPLGDNLACRIVHAENAGQGDPASHCPHSGRAPTAFCVDASDASAD